MNLYYNLKKVLGYRNYGGLRECEGYYRKLEKSKMDLSFLRTCIDQRVKPRFLQFKTFNAIFQNTSCYRQCQEKILKWEYRQKQSQIHRIDRILNQNFQFLKHKYRRSFFKPTF